MRRHESSKALMFNSMTNIQLQNAQEYPVKGQYIPSPQNNRSNSVKQINAVGPKFSNTAKIENPMQNKRVITTTTATSNMTPYKRSVKRSTSRSPVQQRSPKIPDDAVLKEAFIKLGLVIMENRRLRMLLDSRGNEDKNNTVIEKMRDIYESKIDEMNEIIENLKLDLRKSEKQRENMEHEFNDLQGQISARIKDDFNIDSVKEERNVLEDRLRELEEENVRRATNEKSFNDRIGRIQHELNEYKEENIELKEMASRAQSLEIQLDNHQENIELLKGLIETRDNSITSLKKDLKIVEETKLELRKAEDTNKILNKDILKIKENLEKKENLIKVTTEKLVEFNRIRFEIGNKENEIVRLKTDVGRRDDTIQDLRNEITTLRQEMINSRGKLLGLENLKNSLKNMTNELSFKTNQLNSRNSEISDLKEENNLLRSKVKEIGAYRKKLENYVKDNEELQKNIYQLKREKIELENIASKLGEQEEILNERSMKIEDLLNKINNYEESLTEKNLIIDRQGQSIKELSQRVKMIEELRHKMKDQQRAQDLVLDEKNSLERKIEGMKQRETEYNRSFNESQNNLMMKLEEANQRIQLMTEDKKEMNERIAEGIKMKEELGIVSRELNKEKTSNQSLINELNSKTQIIGEIENKLRMASDDLQHKEAQLQYLSELEENYSDLQARASAQEQAIVKLEKELNNYEAEKAKNRELESQLLQVSGHNELLESDLINRDNNLKDLNLEIQKLQEKTKELKNLEKKMKKMAEETINLRELLDNQKLKNTQLMDKYQKLDTQFQRFLIEYDDMKEKYDRMMVVKEDHVTEIENKAIQIGQLQFRVVCLMAELERISTILSYAH